MRIRRWIAWGLLVFVILAVGGAAYGFHAAGYEKYIVETGSMVPKLDPGDLVIDKPAKDGYHVGDVITFRHGPGPDVVTHRIVAITEQGIKTKGDANPTPDAWTIPPDYVQGVVAFRIPKGGYVVTFLSQPAGIAAVTVGLIGLILLWRLFFPTETQAHNEEHPADSDSGKHHASAASEPGTRDTDGHSAPEGAADADQAAESNPADALSTRQSPGA